MDQNLLILIVGLSYAVVYEGMALLRREGISIQFIFEIVILTVLVAGGGYISASTANPILFLVFLYIITSRSRLLVDFANILSNRGRQRDAITTLQVALRLFPDQPTRLIILVNMGIIQLRRQNPESARSLFEMVLEEAKDNGLGIRHHAACHYNLGLAFQKLNQDAKAVRHFKQTTEIFPGSKFSEAALEAIEERRQGKRRKDSNTIENST
jgi:tetratricopeptide (TPR) repeat protein